MILIGDKVKDYLKVNLNIFLPALFCASLFTVPLFKPENMFEGAFFGKEFGLYVLMTILLSYTVISKIFEHDRSKVHLNMIDISFILFITWNFISSLTSGDPYINNKTYELFFLAFFYFIVKNVFSDAELFRSRIILSTMILNIVVLIEVITGLLQLYKIIPSENPYFPITGTFHNPAPYSLFLAISFSYNFAVYSFDSFNSRLSKHFSLISCVAILLIIPFTGNRASWIGIVAGIAFVLFIKYRYTLAKYKSSLLLKTGIISIALVAVLGSVLFLYNHKKGSSDGRLLIWKVSSNIIKEQPLTGVGYGRFNSVYNTYQADYFRGEHNKEEELLADNVRLAYNDYIETTAETGISGLLLLLCLLYFLFTSLKHNTTNLLAFIAPILAFSVLSFISYPLNTIPTKILFFFFAGVLSSKVCKLYIGTNKIMINKLIIICILLFSISIGIKQSTKYLKYDDWVYAYYSLKNGDPQISEEYFSNIQAELKYELRFGSQYAQCLYNNKKYNEALKYLIDIKEIVPDSEIYMLLGNLYEKTFQNHKALECYEEASFMVPGRILPKYYLAKLHYTNGTTNKADSIARIIIDMNIKVRSDTTLSLIKEIKEMYNKNISRLKMP